MREYKSGGWLCPVNDATEERAMSVAGERDTTEGTARALFHHVRDGFCWDMTKVKGATHLLEDGPRRAMSFDKSNLLVALARSIGIPARFNLIRCTFYNKYQDREDSSIHAPVELHIGDEWVTADPAFGKHTSTFKEPASFGERTWEDAKNEKRVAALPRHLVIGYNYLLRFIHPGVRRIRKELRACQQI